CLRVGLPFFYPYRFRMPAAGATGALRLLVAITAACFAVGRRMPYALFGWLWYLGTLVPVIGVIQVGSEAMADRYTYVPQIGLDIAIAWALKNVVTRLRAPAWVAWSAATAVLATLALV